MVEGDDNKNGSKEMRTIGWIEGENKDELMEKRKGTWIEEEKGWLEEDENKDGLKEIRTRTG